IGFSLIFTFSCTLSDSSRQEKEEITAETMQTDFNNLARDLAVELNKPNIASDFYALYENKSGADNTPHRTLDSLQESSPSLINKNLIESNSLQQLKDDMSLYYYNYETTRGKNKEIIVCAADYIKEENENYSVIGYDKSGNLYEVFGLSSIAYVVKNQMTISAETFLSDYAIVGLVMKEGNEYEDLCQEDISPARDLGGEVIYLKDVYFHDVLETWLQGKPEVFLLVFGKDNKQWAIKNYTNIFVKKDVLYCHTQAQYEYVLQWNTSDMGSNLLFYWIEDDFDWRPLLQKIDFNIPNKFVLKVELSEDVTTHAGGFTTYDDIYGDALVYGTNESGAIRYSTGTVKFNLVY
ncbi:MAG: hypothetical protein JXJ04_07875, partial [Spirochaetales bacterium]|nr:hypothetical protein [Spirochaetales bacterium]